MPPSESGSSRGEIEPVRVSDAAEAAMTLLAARMFGLKNNQDFSDVIGT
jgi:hypothetical protein